MHFLIEEYAMTCELEKVMFKPGKPGKFIRGGGKMGNCGRGGREEEEVIGKWCEPGGRKDWRPS